MRSTTLISLGTFLAVLGLATPANAQKKDETKKAPQKEEVDENAGAWSENDKKAEDAPPAPEKKDLSKVEPPTEKWDIYNVDEIPGRYYFFVGLRYRGNVVP